MRKAMIFILALLLPLVLDAQSTKVKGRVTDADTGEGIPFVGVYYKGTTIGISTDLDGNYSIETRDPTAQVLTASILGYDTQEVNVQQHAFQVINFQLKTTNNHLNASLVKPDNRRMKQMLKRINERKPYNDPELKDAYNCDVYSRMELDLTDPQSQIPFNNFWKQFDFTLAYMDTSVVSGQPYLPVMISESKARKYHGRRPYVNKEIIEANRISGIEDENFLSQFTGTMHLKTNFYQDFINVFEQRIPSPLISTGFLYYDYYLIDSLQIDGRKTYYIRFHPGKLVSSPVFDGEMKIDAEDYALREIHAKLARTGTINWVRDLVIDNEHQRVDSTWFYKNDKMYIDMCLFLTDSTNLTSFIGNRQIAYGKPEFSLPKDNRMLNEMTGQVLVKFDADKSPAYWQEVRPFPLSAKEEGIYEMVDQVKDVPFYKGAYSVVEMFINSYLNIGKIGFGPVDQLISRNEQEGVRVLLGARTSPKFSKRVRYMVYGAYGFKDRGFKAGAQMEYLFSKDPERKLSVSGRHDMEQFGRGTNLATSGNIFSSVLSRGGDKRCTVNEYKIKYEHESSMNFNQTFEVLGRMIYGNQYVPLVRYAPDQAFEKGMEPPLETVPRFGYTQFHYGARLSWEETVLRGHFIKTYAHTKYPIIVLDLAGALHGLMSDYSYLRTELTCNYKLPLPPAGNIRFILNTGTIFGNVPYPLLKLHEGNGTHGLDKTAFACMDYYEFASDTWATLFAEYNMGGFILGKIPLLRKLDMREVFGCKVAWGMLSDRNNGTPGTTQAYSAPMLFPQWNYTRKDGTVVEKVMEPLNTPYIEVHAGLSNILRLYRVDANWRLTHRDTARQNFSVTFGFEASF